MPSGLPVQVSGCRCSLCSHQHRGSPTPWTKLQRADMGVINGHSSWWLIPAMDFPTSPSVTPTCVSPTPWPSTGNSLNEGQGSDQELLGSMAKAITMADALFQSSWSIPVETPSWGSQESCSLLTKSPCSCSGQPVLCPGGSKDSSSKNLKITRPCKCYRAEVVTTLCTHRKHNGCPKAELD